ncbi:hypothetical protein DDT52_02595 [Brenneria roseae subsp. roseae]|nr:hypothetical protein DDT52_02595 [Brenneria roseae subsp. roseae]
MAQRISITAFPPINLTVPGREDQNPSRAALLELVQKHIRTHDMLGLARAGSRVVDGGLETI